LISLYYYLQILRQVYIEPTPTENGVAMIEAHPDLTKPPSLSLLAVLAFGAGAIIWLGIYPKPLIDAIEAASRAMLN
ncbi:MAG: hypothetical protein VYC69_07460, partial [Chloroflexota bacterium]|nr:hypothetical protein [Chloroflexota bacterium]